MKNINTNWLRATLSALSVFALLLVAQTQVAAQAKVQRLKVGDRVEDMNTAGEKGTIVEVEADEARNCYLVSYDYQKRTGGGRPGRVCVWGENNKLFLLDAKDKRVRDANAPVADETKPEAQPVETKDNGGVTLKKTDGFQPGDRVEAESGWNWIKCTIVENRTASVGDYILRCDDKPLKEVVFPINRVRAMQGADPDGKRIAEEANRTMGQAIAQCSGEPLLNVKTKGRAASAALFREVIKLSWDKAADQFGEGKTITRISSLTVGAPYRWRPDMDFQLLGKPKTVYPVTVRFATCSDFKIEYRLTERTTDEVYSCYPDDATGEWTCSIHKAGEFVNRAVPKQAYNDIITGKPPTKRLEK